MAKRRQFDAVFKQDAVNYYYSSGKNIGTGCKGFEDW